MAFLTPYRSQILGLTRIAIGLLYWSNGAKKLFGWFGGVGPDGGSVALASRMGAAGAIEFFGGLAIILGVVGFARKESVRAAGGAAVLGGIAMAFQFAVMALGAIVVAILIAAVISQIGIG